MCARAGAAKAPLVDRPESKKSTGDMLFIQAEGNLNADYCNEIAITSFLETLSVANSVR